MRLSHLLLYTAFSIFSQLSSQTPEILNIFSKGSSPKQGSTGTWQLDWTSSSNNTVYRTVYITYTNQTNNSDKLIIDAANNSTNSGWQVQIGNIGSNSWQNICDKKTVKVNNAQNGDTITESVELRYTGSSTGNVSNTLYFGFGNDCGNYTSYGNLEVSINNTSSNLYTWTGQSGTDSLYTTATNWSPTRNSPSTSDILVVDLATTGNPIQTTIDISGVTETIGQFIIYRNNNVTFKCTTDAKWTVGNSISGTDFLQNDSTFIRKTGTGKLEINIPNNNSLNIDGDITTVSGELLFSGAGTHNISGNIKTVGGLLNFTPSSGTNTLFLDGSKQILSGNSYVGSNNTPTLYIDTNFNITVGTSTTNPVDTLTLERTLPVYSVITFQPGTHIISNQPASSSEADWHSWEPYFQLKAPNLNTATKRGQLNVVPTTSKIVGGSQFEIFGTNVRAYRMIGLPFAHGVNLSQFADDIDLTGTVENIANKDSFTTTCSVCKTSAYYWNENTGAWSAYKSGASANVLPKGKGSLIFFRGRKTNGLGDTSAAANEGIIDFKGQLQIGNYNYTLSKTGNAGTLDGFNLVANPYPSNITFDQVYGKHKGKVKPRFRTYDARRKTYNIWDSTVTNSPGKSGARKFANSSSQQAKIIASGAAFFVEAENVNDVIAFTESMKTPFSEPTTAHHGVQEIIETACNELQVNLSYDSDTLFDSDNVTIQFDIDDERVTHEFTETDVAEFYAGYLGIGSLSPSGDWLTIDRRPKMAKVNETYTLPLKTVYPKDALKDLIMDFNFCTNEESHYEILLIDKVKNSSTKVKDLVSYHYQINTQEDKIENRFDLLFTGIERSNNKKQLVKYEFVLFPNPSEQNQFYITNSSNNSINRITISSFTGQVLKNYNIQSTESLVEVNTNDLPNGIYSVQINSQNGSENHTLILE